jgi:hypothetical protein
MLPRTSSARRSHLDEIPQIRVVDTWAVARVAGPISDGTEDIARHRE